MTMSDGEKVHCPECGTSTTSPTMEDAVETAETHDERMHDGEQTTLINGVPVPSDDVAEAAKEALRHLDPEGDDE